MSSLIKQYWGKINGINGLILIVYTVFVLLFSLIVHKWVNFAYFCCFFCLVLLFSLAFCVFAVKTLSGISICITDRHDKRNIPNYIFRIALFIFPLIVLSIYYCAYYPGGFNGDSIYQFLQAETNNYNDWHPVIHTLLFFKLPLLISGGRVGSIVLFQIFCLSAVIGYALNVLYSYTNIKYTLISAMFVLLNPYIGFLAMYPWKDIPFAMGAVLLVSYSLKIYLSDGEWINRPLNFILFTAIASITTLIRHNAMLFTIPLVIAVFFCVKRVKGISMCIALICLCLFIKFPFYSAAGVERPNARQVEVLGIPLNVIGAVVTYSPELTDDETKEFAYSFAPKEVWEENYRYGRLNKVKWNEEANMDIVEEYGFQNVISMMFRCFRESNEHAVIALFKTTETPYCISDKYFSGALGIPPEIQENDYNIIENGNRSLQDILMGYKNIVSGAVPHIFMYLGVVHFFLIAAILSKTRNFIKEWKKSIFILPVFTYNFISNLMMTDIEDAPRFFFYIYLLLPIYILFIFGEKKCSNTKHHRPDSNISK